MQKSIPTIAIRWSAALLLLVAVTGTGRAQLADTRNYGLLAIHEGSAQAYDSLLANYMTRNIVDSYENFVNEFIEIDLDKVDMTGTLPDAVYAERLKMLATEVQMPYNDVVKRYIHVYTRKGGTMERVLGLAQYYFPMIEEMLYRYDLPLELKMMPVIESALIPTARSRAGAMGLWQFMLATGKYYGLEVSSFVDERCNPVKATEAACKYLRDMYKIYGDWTLVIASYNCGQGTVNKALARVPGAKTYWDIYDHLPRETRGYVPAFIAATYAYTYYKAHDLKPTIPWHPLATDTVMVDKMMHFEQVASTLNVPMEVLRGLNPQYTSDIVPAKSQPYALTLPQEYSTAFIRESDAIYGKDSVYLAKYLNVSNLSDIKPSGGTTASGARTTYKVKSGDVLGKIARQYSVTVKQLMSWNNIKNERSLRVGQTLVIYRN